MKALYDRVLQTHPRAIGLRDEEITGDAAVAAVENAVVIIRVLDGCMSAMEGDPGVPISHRRALVQALKAAPKRAKGRKSGQQGWAPELVCPMKALALLSVGDAEAADVVSFATAFVESMARVADGVSACAPSAKDGPTVADATHVRQLGGDQLCELLRLGLSGVLKVFSAYWCVRLARGAPPSFQVSYTQAVGSERRRGGSR